MAVLFAVGYSVAFILFSAGIVIVSMGTVVFSPKSKHIYYYSSWNFIADMYKHNVNDFCLYLYLNWPDVTIHESKIKKAKSIVLIYT